MITTVAGNGAYGYSGDGGPATSAELYAAPLGVAVDASGNIYIADSINNRVREVSNGVITTVAGNGTPGYSGDGGLATSAQLHSPTSVAVDASGNLYIGDAFNRRVREVSSGVIRTVAGGGTGGDGGPATSAGLNVYCVAVDASGDFYIGGLGLVQKVSNGIITAVAGVGRPGFGGDGGPATSASLGNVIGMAFDASGNLYIADEQNARVREVSNGVNQHRGGRRGRWSDRRWRPCDGSDPTLSRWDCPRHVRQPLH